MLAGCLKWTSLLKIASFVSRWLIYRYKILTVIISCRVSWKQVPSNNLQYIMECRGYISVKEHLKSDVLSVPQIWYGSLVAKPRCRLPIYFLRRPYHFRHSSPLFLNLIKGWARCLCYPSRTTHDSHKHVQTHKLYVGCLQMPEATLKAKLLVHL